jgi:3-isopropylmalate dehydrogenase
MTHPKFAANFGKVPVEEISLSTRIFTRRATLRILEAAFEYAVNHNPFRVSIDLT